MRQKKSRSFAVSLIGMVVAGCATIVVGCGAERFSGPPTAGSGGVGVGTGGTPVGEGSGGDGSGGVTGTGGAPDPTAGSGGAMLGTGGGGGTVMGSGGASGSDASVDGPASDSGGSADVPLRLPAPPATWQEHWFEHNQLLNRVAYNDDVAIYFDGAVTRDGSDWMLPYLTAAWQYTRKTYGEIKSNTSDGRMFAIFHQGRYPGAHAASCFDGSHDFRNVVDSGAASWAPTDVGMPAWGQAIVVEAGNGGISGTPGGAVWGGKWTEFFIFDLYTALGRATDADQAQATFTANVDTFPQAGTHWFRDWFYPLWRDHGHAQSMVKFFKLTAQYFPKANGVYTRGMTLAELVHFTSGAAGADLLATAHTAFGSSNPAAADIAKAKSDFPQIKY